MEKLSIELLRNSFDNEVQRNLVTFNNVIIDDPDNAAIIDQFGIFASTLVLISFKNGEIVDSKVLLEATNLYRDENAFKSHLEGEIRNFLITVHE